MGYRHDGITNGRHHYQLPLQPHWVGMIAANYERYDDDIANSPIVQHSGELYGILGVGYTW